MIEIKFRAWDKKREVMHTVFRLMFSDEGGEPFSHEEAQVYFEHEWYSLDRDEYILMQYTGLKDKNGTEAYHGHLVKSKHYEGVGEITWTGTGWAVKVEGDTLLYSLSYEFTIIGNIHESEKR